MQRGADMHVALRLFHCLCSRSLGFCNHSSESYHLSLLASFWSFSVAFSGSLIFGLGHYVL